jgi:hypothetical protein
MSFPVEVVLPVGGEKLTNTVKKHPLGTVGVNQFGERFAYCFSDGAVTAGKVVSSPIVDTDHDLDLVTAAAAVGATEVTVTLGSTAVTLDQYADGVLYVNDLIGEGQKFRIKGHPAADASATVVITLYSNDKVRTALDSTSQCGLATNECFNVVVTPTTDAQNPVGLTCVDVADNAYFWAITRGVASAFTDGTVIVGQIVRTSNGVAGAVEAVSFADDVEYTTVGTVRGVIGGNLDYTLISVRL